MGLPAAKHGQAPSALLRSAIITSTYICGVSANLATLFVGIGRIAIHPYKSRRNSMYNYLIISNINRASGCNFSNDLMLTASEAMPATWGKLMKPIAINRGAVADSAN